jgi:TolB-like protein
VVIMALSLALLLLAAAPAAAPARTKVAVMDVRSVQGVAEGTAAILTDIVVSDVARAGYEVISSNDIVAMLGFEKQKQALGCAEETSCLAELGGALGATYLLSGQVGTIGTQYRVSLILVDTKGARTVSRASEFCEKTEDALVKAARSSVAQLLAAVARPTASLAAQPAASTTQPASPPRSRTAAYISFGVSGALLVGGLVMGLKAQGQYNDLKKLQGQPGYAAAWDSGRSSIEANAKKADLLFVGGALAAGAGVGLWFWPWGDGGRAVAVAPVVAPGAVALAAVGRF